MVTAPAAEVTSGVVVAVLTVVSARAGLAPAIKAAGAAVARRFAMLLAADFTVRAIGVELSIGISSSGMGSAARVANGARVVIGPARRVIAHRH
ncbi:hypothetical protein NSE01_28870 [Novosphingobium sediminis]|uniref:Uncharacterized protein n=1 Tax=Novosphingobium sediminis TaxID=707214 RepID=A0A512AMW8_9SPHN|nr:hypothetical protein NSE01_28870 [Novosphingobium sediminis]